MTKLVLIPDVLSDYGDEVEAAALERGWTAKMLPPLCEEDIAYGMESVDNDICVAVIAEVGQIIRALEADPGQTDVALLRFCPDCQALDAGHILNNALAARGHASVHVHWLDWEAIALKVEETAARAEAGTEAGMMAPRVGIVGLTPLVFNRYQRASVEALIARKGFETVFPKPCIALTREGFLLESIAELCAEGAKVFLCLLPFECLYGQLWVKGALLEIGKRFPDVRLSVVDIDPHASELNLISRVELLLSQ